MLKSIERYSWSHGSNYGEATPTQAAQGERQHLRVKRLADSFGKDAKLDLDDISRKFEIVADAIKAADDQFFADNKVFLEDHGITPSETS